MGILRQRLAARAARKRKQETRRRKAEAKSRYMDYRRTLPVEKDLVIAEARNGKTIDGNLFYLMRELATKPE